jgi:hypothetical protein
MWGSNSGRSKKLFSFKKRADQFWTDSYFLGRTESLPGGKMTPGLRLNILLYLLPRLKNEWSIYPFALHAFMECAGTTLLRVFTELAFCPIVVAVRSKTSVCSRLLGLRVRILLGTWMFVSCDCSVLSCRGVCDGPISRPEESKQVRSCARARVSLIVSFALIILNTCKDYVQKGQNKKKVRTKGQPCNYPTQHFTLSPATFLIYVVLSGGCIYADTTLKTMCH